MSVTWGNSGLSPQRVVVASPDQRAMLMLAHLLTARRLCYHEDMPAPVLTMPSGAEVGGWQWSDVDRLLEQGLIALTETEVAPTPAGRAAAKRWARKYRVEVSQ